MRILGVELNEDWSHCWSDERPRRRVEDPLCRLTIELQCTAEEAARIMSMFQSGAKEQDVDNVLTSGAPRLTEGVVQGVLEPKDDNA